MRTPLFLLLGLAVGITGTLLVSQSLPPEEGSPAARIEELDRELARTRVALAAAEARNPKPGATTRQKLAQGANDIIQDIKDGKTVDMNDIYQAAKPALRDLSPIFDRLHRRDLRRHNKFVLADLTRKYHLTPAQQEALKSYQEIQAEQQMAAFRAFNLADSTTLEDMVRASHKKPRPQDGLDAFMNSTLTGKDLERYRADRLTERVENVQAEADRRVSRLNSLVSLDEAQQDQVFSLMARSSPDFDPSMQFEGLSGDTAKLDAGQSREEAIMQVLRPEQRIEYETKRAERRAEAQKEFDDIGVKIPDNWDMLADE